MINVQQITSKLRMMPDQQLQNYAMQNKDDPYTVSLALSEANTRKQVRTSQQAKTAGMQPPKVVDQDIAGMAAVDPMGNVIGALPEDMGIGRLAAPNLKRMADGGIVGFAGDEGSVTRMSGADLFEKALNEEGITDPLRRAFAKAIHGQESSGKANAPTSNRGAAGPMQVRGAAWKDVATPDMDHKNPFDNMRAGIRYAMKGFDAANGNPVLAGAHYYGGPGGMKKLMEGKAVSDPQNPKAPTTEGYGKSVAERMVKFLPVGSAEAADMQKIVDTNPTATLEATSDASATGNVPTSQRTGAIIPASQLAGAGIGALDKIRGLYNTYGPTTRTGSMFRNLRPATQLGIAAEGAAATALPVSAVGMGGATLAQGAANALSNATPEQLEMLQNEVGSDTGLAAAIMNPANRGPQPNQMPYGQQMTELGKRIVSYPTGEKPKEEVPASTDRLSPQVPDELKRIESAQRSAAEDVQVKPPEPVAAAPATGEKTTSGGLASLFKDPAFLMGMRLMASKDPRFLGAAGEAGIGTVGDLAAAEKASSESEYRKAMGKYYGAYADAIERGAKEKNEVQSAEKAAQEALDNWSKNNKMALLQSPGLYDQMRDKYRMDAYSAFGIKMPQAIAQQGAPRNDPLGILGKG
jgi:hypothetical protein